MNPNITLAAAPSSYNDHIATLTQRYEAALTFCKLKAIAVHAGEQIPVFLDDQHYRHKPNPHLLQWLPLFGLPDSCLVFESGKKPRLLVLVENDFWHAAPQLPDETYLSHFDIELIHSGKEYQARLDRLPRKTGHIDPASTDKHDNPAKLLNFLHFHRSIKTGYEVECIRAATGIAMVGHAAAHNAFLGGGSGFEIHTAWLSAVGCSEHELPYPDIVACNQNGATLHYEHREHIKNPHSLLIDAGTAMNGYACDITRSYSTSESFNALVDAVDTLQQELCGLLRPGISFGEAQHRAHLGIGAILKEFGLVALSPEEQLTNGITNAFFPHGLGHMLGLQVHDVGGHMADERGKTQPAPPEYPNLRMSRTLEAGMVLTVEPGLYFIPMLLDQLRNGEHANAFDWAQIDELAIYGGIRIEDNMVLTADGARNITREA